MSRMLSLDATAALVGHACWVEGRCFEILGAWVPSVPEPEVKLLLARHSRHHGWHVEVLAEVQPSTRDHDPDAFATARDDRWRAALDVVHGPAGASSIERLAGVYQALLPRLVAGYDQTLDATSPVSDGPLARRLRLVVDDERSDLAEGLGVLEGLLAADADLDHAARRRVEVEAALPPR